MILALELHETGGGSQARQVGIPMLLPCESAWVERAFPGECRWTKVGGWDEARGKVIQEEQLLFRGLPLERRAVKEGALDPAESARLLVEKLAAGDIVLPRFDDEARQMVNRIRLTARMYPEYGIPALDEDDWRLIYDAICEGKASEKELENVSVTGALREYLGPGLMAFVDRSAPTTMKLPGVRQGKLTYFENSPPELSARLGDFIGLEGRMTLMDGKVEVVYRHPRAQLPHRAENLRPVRLLEKHLPRGEKGAEAPLSAAPLALIDAPEMRFRRVLHSDVREW